MPRPSRKPWPPMTVTTACAGPRRDLVEQLAPPRRRRARSAPSSTTSTPSGVFGTPSSPGELASSCRRARAGSGRPARSADAAPRAAARTAACSSGGSRGLARLGATRSERHGERAVELRFDAAAPELLLVDVEHLALAARAASPPRTEPRGGEPPAARGLTANTGEYIFTPAGIAERRDVRRQSGGDIACGAVAAREQHEATRPRRRGRAAAADVSAARSSGRRRVGHDDRARARPAARRPRPSTPPP